MRKITEKSVGCFMNATKFSEGNTSVEVQIVGVNARVVMLKLHGNTIAEKHENPHRIIITTCGWNTQTTRERLNGIPGVSTYTRKGQLYLNGEKWDGKKIEVKG
jgi:hypothetical protein